MTDQPQHDHSDHETPPPTDQTGRVVPSHELFQGEREIWIEHEGVQYRLRITRRNRLILQK